MKINPISLFRFPFLCNYHDISWEISPIYCLKFSYHCFLQNFAFKILLFYCLTVFCYFLYTLFLHFGSSFAQSLISCIYVIINTGKSSSSCILTFESAGCSSCINNVTAGRTCEKIAKAPHMGDNRNMWTLWNCIYTAYRRYGVLQGSVFNHESWVLIRSVTETGLRAHSRQRHTVTPGRKAEEANI